MLKHLQLGTAFGGYINVRETLVWEFELFLFLYIELMLVYKFSVCLIRSWHKINPFIPKYSKNRKFLIRLLQWSYYTLHMTICKITRTMSLSHLSMTSLPSWCPGDSDSPPWNAHHKATKVRLTGTSSSAMSTLWGYATHRATTPRQPLRGIHRFNDLA